MPVTNIAISHLYFFPIFNEHRTTTITTVNYAHNFKNEKTETFVKM